MRLWIVRHGKAEKDSASGLDRDRRLRKRGERQASHIAAELAGRPDAPALVCTSPFERALKTARPIAEALGVELREVGALESGRGAQSVLAFLQEMRAVESLAIVGHNPELSQVASVLVLGVDRPLRTGEAAGIDYDPGAGEGVLDELIRLEEG